MESIVSQFYAFFVTIAIGFAVGLIFDLYRILRNFCRPKKIATGIGDILFWIVVTAVVFILLIFGNWGQLRLYVFIGLAMGIRIYLRLFSKFFIRLFKNTFILTGKGLRLLGRGLVFVGQMLLFPVRLAKNIVIVPLGLLSLTWCRIWRFTRRLGHSCLLRPLGTWQAKVKGGFRSCLGTITKRKRK